MKKGMRWTLLLVLVLMAGAMVAQSNSAVKAADAKTADAKTADAKTADAKTDDKNTQPAETAQPFGGAADYVIGADDVLKITVWKEPDLTEQVPVRPDGRISMPLLDDIPAAGMTPQLLRDLITARLKKYISDPRVTVVVVAMNSRRVFVTGEVTHSGPMNLLPHMTVLQALAEAGFTQFANLKSIYLLRTENGQQVKIPFNYKEVVKGNHPEQNIALKPGDTVVVP